MKNWKTTVSGILTIVLAMRLSGLITIEKTL
jgi:hypothetical protein